MCSNGQGPSSATGTKSAATASLIRRVGGGADEDVSGFGIFGNDGVAGRRNGCESWWTNVPNAKR